jgi:hypothetical protein
MGDLIHSMNERIKNIFFNIQNEFGELAKQFVILNRSTDNEIIVHHRTIPKCDIDYLLKHIPANIKYTVYTMNKYYDIIKFGSEKNNCFEILQEHASNVFLSKISSNDFDSTNMYYNIECIRLFLLYEMEGFDLFYSQFEDFISTFEDCISKETDTYKLFTLIDGDNRDTAFIENESFLGTSILNKVKKDLQNNELLFGIDKIVNYDIKLDKKECPYVHVRGAYLEQIQYIPSIDFTRTISNNYNEVQKFYGLLAAKNVFYEELSKCLGTITPQMRDSLKIIVNMLSKNGEFVGINKQGLEKNNFSFLSLLSFESPMTVIETTLNPKTDTLDSVSSQLITGNF